ncbi:MAG: hypothetical protein OXB92_01190 [Acidimicrobiaceae bacterium]|nr:hypothetical protein [Acidimicrobiia bacterium]MCY4492456.1 hypothetical protein [Acidimicrobiaceae bacterium]
MAGEQSATEPMEAAIEYHAVYFSAVAMLNFGGYLLEAVRAQRLIETRCVVPSRSDIDYNVNIKSWTRAVRCVRAAFCLVERHHLPAYEGPVIS